MRENFSKGFEEFKEKDKNREMFEKHKKEKEAEQHGNYYARQRKSFERMYGVESTNAYYKAREKEFSKEEKDIAKIDWEKVLNED